MTYETPQVSDYGDLIEVTAAIGTGSAEDGHSKRHHTPFGSRPI